MSASNYRGWFLSEYDPLRLAAIKAEAGMNELLKAVKWLEEAKTGPPY